jgi:hypothetical protein
MLQDNDVGILPPASSIGVPDNVELLHVGS